MKIKLTKIKRNNNSCGYCGVYGQNKYLYTYEFGELIPKKIKEICYKCAKSVLGKTKEFNEL